MRNRTYRVLPLFLITFLLLSGANAPLTTPAAARSAVPAAVAVPTDATLSGQLRDATSLVGVRGRLLFLTSPVPVNPVDTDANGNYTVALPSGEYYIEYTSGRCLLPIYRTVTIASTNITLNADLNRTLDTQQYGYSCDDEVAFNWIPGNNLTGTLFHDQQVGVNMPFAFSYYGSITGTVAWVTPAGYLTLGEHDAAYLDSHVQIPDPSLPNNAIYPYWDQFVTSTRGGVYTATVGTAPNRKFVIEWRDMVLFTDDPQNPSPLNFEVVFYEGGSGGQPGTLMDIQYMAVGNSTSGQGRNATVGIENTNGTGALPYLFDEVGLTNNTTIHIYQPPLGGLSGHVTDFYTHLPLRAKVCAAGTELCQETNATTGAYTMRLIEAPYGNVQASASRHVSETRSITITRGITSTLDFALNSAHVDYNPGAVNVALGPNQVSTSTLVLNNIGTGVLQYRLREALGPEPVGCGSLAAPAPEGSYIIEDQRTVPQAADNSTKAGGTDQMGHYRYVVNSPNAVSVPPANILLYADDSFHGTSITTTYPSQALALLGWSYTGYYNDPTGFITALSSPPAGGWSLVIVANDRNSSLQNNFESLRTYMDGSPNARMVFQTYKYETTIPTTLFDRLGITQPITESSDVVIPETVTAWEPTEFIFRCPLSLSSSLRMTAPPFPGYQDYGDTLNANSIGLEWGGYTIDPTPGQAAIVARDDGRSVSAGFIVSTLTHDDNGNGKDDGVDLFENLIKYVGNPPIPWGDIPWLTETPLNGTVGATSQFSATLTFNATGLAPGTYVGYLFGLSNDPNAVRHQIQVTLTVCTGSCGGDLEVSDIFLHGYGSSRPVTGQVNQVRVTVKNVGIGPITFPNNYLYVDLYTDPNPSPPTSSTSTPYFGVIPGQTLLPQQSTVVEITWTPPTAGDHRLWAWVNRECLPQVGEPDCTGSNTGNNNLLGPVSGCVFTNDGYSFTDAPANSTFSPYIEQLYCVGAISGYPCGGANEPCLVPTNRPYFRVGNNATRGQFTKILSAALGWTDPATGQTFQDVPSTNTFYLYIQRAASRGLIAGYVCGANAFEPCVGPTNRPYFRPNNNLTRGQISKVVVLAKAWITGTPTPVPTAAPYTFQDVPPTNTFYSYVEQAAAHSVISGYACGGVNEPCVPPTNRRYFRPNNNATRGQLSKIIVVSASQP